MNNTTCRQVRAAALASLMFATMQSLAVGLVEDDRRVTTFFDAGSNEFFPPQPFAPFSVTGQNTTVSPTLFSGSGSSYGESDFEFFIRESYFDITFSVTEPTIIDLAGDYDAAPGDFGYAEVRVRLFDVSARGGALYSATLAADFEPVFDQFSHSQTLANGTYRLLIETSTTPGGFDTYGNYSFTAGFTPDPSIDTDSDGVADFEDNCTTVSNATQTDADADGIGNRCDADLNNDCVINAEDLGAMRQAFFSTDAVADLNVDSVVNAFDLALMKATFFGAPGPSGIPNLCNSP